jgi:adenylate cyclase
VPPGRVARKLVAILAADVAGYSRLMGADEEGTLARVKGHYSQCFDPKIAEHGGRIVKTTGDGLLVEFPSVVDATRCAIDIQCCMAERNEDLPEGTRIEFRMGINVGDIIVDGDDIHGDGVNVAARLEGIAEPGGICVSEASYQQIRDKMDVRCDDLGSQHLKNIARPIQAYRVALGVKPKATTTPTTGQADNPSIAVLPFTNMSGDAAQEYFADGLTDDIITELSRIRFLSVIARHSTFVYKGKAVDVKQIGRELGVRYILEGSVRRANERVRVTAQLIETAEGNHVWVEKYDRDVSDIFDVQDEITRSVVGSTQTQIVISEGALAERSERPAFRSWDLAKRGWKMIYGLTPESFQHARTIGLELTRTDPSFAKGHQLLGTADYHLAQVGFSDNARATHERALLSMREAIRLDDRDEYSHWMLGGILGQGLGYYDKAIAAYQRALELNPNFSLAYGSLGAVLALAGRADESILNLEICIKANPRDPSIFFRFAGLALAYFIKEDYARSREWAEKAVARKREWWLGHALLAISCAYLGENVEARAAVQEYLSVYPQAKVGNLPPLPLKNADDAQRFYEGLRKAGLPE